MNKTSKRKPAPEDFAAKALGKTNDWLARHYTVGHKTITRWRKEAKAPATFAMISFHGPRSGMTKPVSTGRIDEAIRFLQPTHRPVYNRGKVEGKQFKGQFVVGRKILTENELIELAKSKGFEKKSDWSIFK